MRGQPQSVAGACDNCSTIRRLSSLLDEELIEVDDRAGKGGRPDDAAVRDGFVVGAARLAPPAGECAIEGVEAPDLLVAAALVAESWC